MYKKTYKGGYNENYCSNCNMTGHMYYNCKKPLLSNGIIAVKISKNEDENQYLMVKRKHTFGFIDFVRGKYSVNNKSHLMGMLNEMSLEEKDKIMKSEFFYLWNYLWGNSKANNVNKDEPTTTKNLNFDNEKKHAENKLKTLKEGVYLENDNYNLQQLIDLSTTSWSEPEWEFPKGRKNMGENDIECAFREFVEETGYTYNNLLLFRNMVPYEEIFIGSNYESYKNKYFVCSFLADSANNPQIAHAEQATSSNKFDKYEISDVQWFTYSQCLERIRSYNYEKKRLLTNVNETLKKYTICNI